MPPPLSAVTAAAIPSIAARIAATSAAIEARSAPPPGPSGGGRVGTTLVPSTAEATSTPSLYTRRG